MAKIEPLTTGKQKKRKERKLTTRSLDPENIGSRQTQGGGKLFSKQNLDQFPNRPLTNLDQTKSSNFTPLAFLTFVFAISFFLCFQRLDFSHVA